MRILWITNVLLPPVCGQIGTKTPISGGWLFSSLSALKEKGEHIFAVASPYKGKEYEKIALEGIIYYLLPINVSIGKDCSTLIKYWKNIVLEFKPDVVHIHGSEFSLGHSYIQACGSSNVVVSIQGLAHEIARYYYSAIPYRDIIINTTARDIIFGGIFRERHNFVKAGKKEIELYQNVKNVIGRTNWDESHVKYLNPNIRYFHCNETLRPAFYNQRWEYSKCVKQRIFVGQSNYPVKGLHLLIQAIPSILHYYPELDVRIAGKDFVTIDGLYSKLKDRTYAHYLRSLIKKHGLESRIHFLGVLNEQEVLRELLYANVFVCPSSIENSSNSLCEAQLVGIPCVASHAGGNPDIISSKEHGILYRYDDIPMLCQSVCTALHNSRSFDNTSQIRSANLRHDVKQNLANTLKIYDDIANENSYLKK